MNPAHRNALRLLVLATAASLCIPAASAGNSPPPRVGADRDRHGCIASAGYTFSQLRKDCVRLWEAGIRLDPVRPDRSQTASAFVVFKGEAGSGPAELFLPGAKGTIILRQVTGESAGLWRSRSYRLSQWRGMYSLDNARGRPLYQGPAA